MDLIDRQLGNFWVTNRYGADDNERIILVGHKPDNSYHVTTLPSDAPDEDVEAALSMMKHMYHTDSVAIYKGHEFVEARWRRKETMFKTAYLTEDLGLVKAGTCVGVTWVSRECDEDVYAVSCTVSDLPEAIHMGHLPARKLRDFCL